MFLAWDATWIGKKKKKKHVSDVNSSKRDRLENGLGWRREKKTFQEAFPSTSRRTRSRCDCALINFAKSNFWACHNLILFRSLFFFFFYFLSFTPPSSANNANDVDVLNVWCPRIYGNNRCCRFSQREREREVYILILITYYFTIILLLLYDIYFILYYH